MQVEMAAQLRIVDAAYVKALKRVQEFVAALSLELETPAMMGLGEERRQGVAQQAYLAFLSELLYTSNLAIGAALKSQTVTQQDLEMLEMQAAHFIGDVLQGKRFYCTAAPCEWRGTLEAIGPGGICPGCKLQTLKASPVVEQAGPQVPPFKHDGLGKAVLL